MSLVTGGSGIAPGLAANFLQDPDAGVLGLEPVQLTVTGATAVVAGSCSPATKAQVAHWRRHNTSFYVDALKLVQGADVVGEAVAWARPRLNLEPVLVYSTSSPETVARVQAEIGAEGAGAAVEEALAEITSQLVQLGVRRLVVAGGETSGAVVKKLGIQALRIGKQIDPGVPWTVTTGNDPTLALALKSGNFGSEDFFANALRVLDSGDR
jgi:uncharacterized protein YgbK (DUF1537 family)